MRADSDTLVEDIKLKQLNVGPPAEAVYYTAFVCARTGSGASPCRAGVHQTLIHKQHPLPHLSDPLEPVFGFSQLLFFFFFLTPLVSFTFLSSACSCNTLPSRRTLKNSRLVCKKDDVHVCIMCLRAIMNYQVSPSPDTPEGRRPAPLLICSSASCSTASTWSCRTPTL